MRKQVVPSPAGKGVRTIMEMVAMTRFDCMIGSSAGMRMAASQALHHCGQRKAFGQLLVDQPLMQNVLADLALEADRKRKSARPSLTEAEVGDTLSAICAPRIPSQLTARA